MGTKSTKKGKGIGGGKPPGAKTKGAGGTNATAEAKLIAEMNGIYAGLPPALRTNLRGYMKFTTAERATWNTERIRATGIERRLTAATAKAKAAAAA